MKITITDLLCERVFVCVGVPGVANLWGRTPGETALFRGHFNLWGRFVGPKQVREYFEVQPLIYS